MNKQTQLNRKIQVALTTITDQISANRRFLRKYRRRQMASHWLKMLAIVVGLTGVGGMFAYFNPVVQLVAQILTAVGMVVLSATLLLSNDRQTAGRVARAELADQTLWLLKDQLTDLAIIVEFADPETADWTQMDEKYHLLKNDMYRIGLQVPVTALDGKPVEAEKIVPTEEDQQ